MKVTDLTKNGYTSEKRIDVESSPGNPANQASDSDDLPVMMNKPGLQPRGSRADQLIEVMGDDSYRLGTEAPRKSKMKG